MQFRLLFSMLFSMMVSVAFAQITTVGIIGPATPGGWDVDTDLTQSTTNPDVWTISMPLVAGEAKFRTNDDWAVNWGFETFPYGTGLPGGPNIPVSHSGDYVITINVVTGDYTFAIASPIGIVGDATPGGWDNDTNLFPDSASTNLWSITMPLKAGPAKFRQDDAWTINWGSTDFPSGTGTQDGMNIPIPNDGNYKVSFNSATGAYNFEEVIPITSIALRGTATGGVGGDITLARSGNIWKGDVSLMNGTVQFIANQDANWVYGGTDFPNGVATIGGPALPISAGLYRVTFNMVTLEYTFAVIENYNSISILGDATAGGWDTDTPLTQDPSDPTIWRARLILANGLAKFRANNDWTNNWGAGTFPTGTGVLDGPEIPVVAGEYKITFNTLSGEYNFEELQVFQTVGIIGTASPTGGWDTDTDLTKDTVDESFWYANSMVMTNGLAKFRAEDAWTINWGATGFPTGLGTQDGPDIPITAGTYYVSINTGTGEYGFLPALSTVNLVKNNAVKFSPNPANTFVNIEISEEALQGDLSLRIVDQSGRVVMTQEIFVQNTARLDVSRLAAGTYMVHITNGKYVVGKNLVVVK